MKATPDGRIALTASLLGAETLPRSAGFRAPDNTTVPSRRKDTAGAPEDWTLTLKYSYDELFEYGF